MLREHGRDHPRNLDIALRMIEPDDRPSLEGAQQVGPKLPGGANDDNSFAVRTPDARALPNRSKSSWQSYSEQSNYEPTSAIDSAERREERVVRISSTATYATIAAFVAVLK